MDRPDELEGIAIIGMSGRFPKARDVDQFWRNLVDGLECVSFPSSEELIAAGNQRSEIDQPNYIKAGCYLEDTDMFDAAFFGINPKEAELMDPQHRIFLEVSWEALESAGYNPYTYPGEIGVWAGCSISTYMLYNLDTHFGKGNSLPTVLGNDKDYLSTRVSYKLNLRGPSVAVQSACSTSLVAVHMACDSLLDFQCDIALAGGIATRSPQKMGYVYEQGSILSPDGHCRTFDERAEGTIFGSGAGVVALKRLKDAIADGDTIYAVIKGSAVNNDGIHKIGYTAPSVDGQARVVAMAQAMAGVTPDSIGYVEAHGTGTALGDPIEVAALTQAFRAGTDRKNFCAIGSVKTNVGHLDTAAGVTGLIKAALALHRETIPASINFERPNPDLHLDESPFFVNDETREWKRNGAPRRAGVSAFGIGGTNAHAVLEEAPEVEPSGASRPSQLLVISARTTSALDTASDRLAERLEREPDLSLADVAYTLAVGRHAFGNRRVVAASSAAAAAEALRARDPRRVFTASADNERSVAFMFPGQGAQYAGMGRELYDTEPRFRERVDRCAELLQPALGLDLRTLLFPAEGAEAEAGERLTQTAVTQPALFVIEYALAATLMDWGVRPTAMIGHSIGEYVAAHLAGVFTLESALALVAARGALMQGLPAGSMLAVPLPEEEVRPLLGRELSLAAVNGASLCVASGTTPSVEALHAELAGRGVECRTLHTSHAFHSEMMEGILSDFAERVRAASPRPPSIPFVSNVTGTWITAAEATDPAYWATHLRQTVRFADGLDTLGAEPGRVLLEVGPGRTLATLARRHPGRPAGQSVLTTMRHPEDAGSDLELLLTAVGRLWANGVEPEWDAFFDGERRRRVPLPTYPFERQRYWMALRSTAIAESAAATARAPRLRADLADWFYAPSWKRSPLATAVSQPGEGECALVFAREGSLGDELAKRLERAGRAVAVVRPGTAFARLDERAFSVRPGESEDYDAVLAALAELGLAPVEIAHAWNAGGAPAEEAEQELGFYSLVALAQALGRAGDTREVRLLVVSDGLQDVTGDETIEPAKATVLGPVRVLPVEYPTLDCRSVDVVVPEGGSAARKRLLEQLEVELGASAGDRVVAYRGAHRWVQTFEPVRVDAAAERSAPLREGGVYLVTGGLGGVGLALAEDLARTVEAKLVLLGRSAMPDRATWDEGLADPDTPASVKEKISRVRELERLGAEVLVVAADVADRASMEAAVAGADARFGRIDGVIHSAGVPGGGVVQRKTREVADAVLAPKLTGTAVLDAIFRDRELDFFALCSSLSSVLGGFGQVDYCAANAFLDAYARRARAEGRPVVSLDWDAWQDVGMAADAAKRAAAPRADAEVVTRAVAHPIFETRTDVGGERSTYSGRMSVARHWALRDHRVAGTATLPGTAYLELARWCFEEREGEGPVELEDVYFLAPLTVGDDDEREVRASFARQKQGFAFTVESRAAEGAWQVHARGEINRAEERPVEERSLADIRLRCDARDVEITNRERESQRGFIDFGPRWNNLERIRFGAGEGIASLVLPADLAGDVEEYGLHPALMDSATGFLSILAREQGAFLPFTYRKIRVERPLPPVCFSHARFAAGNQPESGTLELAVEVLDERGRVLVDIEGYILRRVELDRGAPEGEAVDAPNYTLEVDSPGMLASLTYRPSERRAPGPGEVEIEIAASGLNFKEVLIALGMFPLPRGGGAGFGLEGAGRIAAVGEGVDDFAVGDRVYALARPTFSPYITTPTGYVAKLPDHLTPEEAATIPVAFLTAYFSLVTLGRLAPGERVLIHAAAGGVGLAAIQVARYCGAEIYGTAGSDEKRDFLRSIGVENVADSRSLSFADDVMRMSDGRGVDAVLNSLGGEFIAKGLEVLAPFGRFLEIGKRDIYANTPLGLRPFEKGLSFYAIDIAPRDTADMRRAWGELVELVANGTFEPLRTTVFPIDEVAGAFDLMARAKHIGKIVVSLEDREAVRRLATPKTTVARGWHAAAASASRVASAPGSAAEARAASTLEDALKPADAAVAFRRALGAGLAQLAVTRRDLVHILEHGFEPATEPAAEPGGYRPSHPRPALATEFAGARSESEETIAAIWQELLGIETVGIHDDFYELGGDSLLATQVVGRMRAAFGIEIAVAAMFEQPTVGGLAEHVDAIRWSSTQAGATAVDDGERDEGLL